MTRLEFFFSNTSTTEIYTLSLHDALPISRRAATAPRSPPGRGRAADQAGSVRAAAARGPPFPRRPDPHPGDRGADGRSEEHTSELQCQYLVCRLLLEKNTVFCRPSYSC